MRTLGRIFTLYSALVVHEVREKIPTRKLKSQWIWRWAFYGRLTMRSLIDESTRPEKVINIWQIA